MFIKKTAACFFIIFVIFGIGFLRAEPLKVGVSPANPPVIFYERNTVSGVEADFANGLGEFLGRPVKFVDLDWKDQIPALLAGEIDIIMSGMSITRIRSLQVRFCNPYYRVGQMALVRREEANDYVLPQDIIFTRKKVGAEKHTTGEFLIQQNFPHARKYLFSTPKKGANALKRKRIDLLILDSPCILWLAAQNEREFFPAPLLLTEEDLAWAVRKEDQDLLQGANRFLAEWRENGKLDNTLERWMPSLQ